MAAIIFALHPMSIYLCPAVTEQPGNERRDRGRRVLGASEHPQPLLRPGLLDKL